MNMKKTILSTAIVASLVLLVGCSYDYKEITHQCEAPANKYINQGYLATPNMFSNSYKIKYITEQGNGIVNITYGHSNNPNSPNFDNKVVYCAIQDGEVHINANLYELEVFLGVQQPAVVPPFG